MSISIYIKCPNVALLCLTNISETHKNYTKKKKKKLEKLELLHP